MCRYDIYMTASEVMRRDESVIFMQKGLRLRSPSRWRKGCDSTQGPALPNGSTCSHRCRRGCLPSFNPGHTGKAMPLT